MALEGAQVPGLSGGVVWSNFFDTPLNFNDNGQALFKTNLRGGNVTPETATSLWLADPNSAPRLLLREGDLMEIAPGLTKTVADFSFLTSSVNQNRRSASLSASGDVVVNIVFTDFTQAVIVVPESTVALQLSLFFGLAAISFIARASFRRLRSTNS